MTHILSALKALLRWVLGFLRILYQSIHLALSQIWANKTRSFLIGKTNEPGFLLPEYSPGSSRRLPEQHGMFYIAGSHVRSLIQSQM